MCGIAGYWIAPGIRPPSADTLARMTDALAHRGPDDCGYFHDQRCSLGHRRLAIIDLDGGRQPLENEDRSIVVVANGEIYNHRALRAELAARGHRFRTKSDCEVLVHLWEEHGSGMLEHLRGMFAFVLYDRTRQQLFGARDFFGQKPLFYRYRDGTFSFASEIKGLLAFPGISRDLDPVAVDEFLFHQFVPHPRTLFREIRQLPPGCWFRLEGQSLEIGRYWRHRVGPARRADDQRLLADAAAAVADAVESHLESDVPLGVFLSGGVDSSLITALAARRLGPGLKSFAVVFDDPHYDESQHARQLASRVGTEHREIRFRAGDVPAQMDAMLAIYDQPIADRAILPLLRLAEQTAAEVKVVLTGDGGDELFAGYGKYRRAAASGHLAAAPRRWLAERFRTGRLAQCRPDRCGTVRLRVKLASVLRPQWATSYFKPFWAGWQRWGLYSDALREQLREPFTAIEDRQPWHDRPADPLAQMLQCDASCYLPDDLLLKTDYATMAFGLEARAPLLDHRLAEVASALPRHLLATPTQTKVALRRIAGDWIPAELCERPKRGFGMPLRRWYAGELQPWLSRTLLEESTTVPRLFRREAIERLLSEHASKRRNHALRIHALLVFELWHRRYGC